MSRNITTGNTKSKLNSWQECYWGRKMIKTHVGEIENNAQLNLLLILNIELILLSTKWMCCVMVKPDTIIRDRPFFKKKHKLLHKHSIYKIDTLMSYLLLTVDSKNHKKSKNVFTLENDVNRKHLSKIINLRFLFYL